MALPAMMVAATAVRDHHVAAPGVLATRNIATERQILRNFGSAWLEANRRHVSHAQLKVMSWQGQYAAFHAAAASPRADSNLALIARAGWHARTLGRVNVHQIVAIADPAGPGPKSD